MAAIFNASGRSQKTRTIMFRCNVRDNYGLLLIFAVGKCVYVRRYAFWNVTLIFLYKTVHIADKTVLINDKTVYIADKTVHIADKTVQIADKTVHIADKTEHIADKTVHIADKTVHILQTKQ